MSHRELTPAHLTVGSTEPPVDDHLTHNTGIEYSTENERNTEYLESEQEYNDYLSV